MNLKVLPEEKYIRNMIKSVGGHWNPKKQLWELPYKEIEALGLNSRIVDNEK